MVTEPHIRAYANTFMHPKHHHQRQQQPPPPNKEEEKGSAAWSSAAHLQLPLKTVCWNHTEVAAVSISHLCVEINEEGVSSIYRSRLCFILNKVLQYLASCQGGKFCVCVCVCVCVRACLCACACVCQCVRVPKNERNALNAATDL